MKATIAASFLLSESLFALAVPAQAQDTAAAATPPAEGLGEIVVTANRVASSAQDVDLR